MVSDAKRRKQKQKNNNKRNKRKREEAKEERHRKDESGLLLVDEKAEEKKGKESGLLLVDEKAEEKKGKESGLLLVDEKAEEKEEKESEERTIMVIFDDDINKPLRRGVAELKTDYPQDFGGDCFIPITDVRFDTLGEATRNLEALSKCKSIYVVALHHSKGNIVMVKGSGISIREWLDTKLQTWEESMRSVGWGVFIEVEVMPFIQTYARAILDLHAKKYYLGCDLDHLLVIDDELKIGKIARDRKGFKSHAKQDVFMFRRMALICFCYPGYEKSGASGVSPADQITYGISDGVMEFLTFLGTITNKSLDYLAGQAVLHHPFILSMDENITYNKKINMELLLGVAKGLENVDAMNLAMRRDGDRWRQDLMASQDIYAKKLQRSVFYTHLKQIGKYKPSTFGNRITQFPTPADDEFI